MKMRTLAVLVVVVAALVVFATDLWTPWPQFVGNRPGLPEYPGTTYVISLGREWSTNGTATPAEDMPCWSLQVNQSRTIHALQGDLVVSKTNLLDVGFKQAEFSWWISPQPFACPLSDYYTFPPSTMILGSDIVETWHSSITVPMAINLGNVSLPAYWFVTIVIDVGTPFTHAESEASLVVS